MQYNAIHKFVRILDNIAIHGRDLKPLMALRNFTTVLKILRSDALNAITAATKEKARSQ